MRSSTPSNLDHDSEEIGVILSRISIALFIVFVAVIIASALPPRLLNPTWQLRFVSSLVNNGTIAVVGYVLLWLSTLLNPGDGRLRARRDQFAAFAAAAAIGYLLLIPLQTYAAWNGVNTVDSARSTQLKRANTRIQQLRQATKQAGSTAELQSRLRTLNGPTLSAPDLAKPIDVLRPQILTGLETAESRLRQQLGGLPPDRIWQLVQESIRVSVSALAFSFAYAAGAFLPGRSESLFDSGSAAFRNLFRRRPSLKKSGGRGGSLSNEEYLRELSREEDSPPKRKG